MNAPNEVKSYMLEMGRRARAAARVLARVDTTSKNRALAAIAAAIRADGALDKLVQDRYSSWDTGIGAEIEAGKQCFKGLEKYMLEKGEITPNKSGRQEMIENLINTYL